MSPAMTYDLWHFEQEWIASHDSTNETLRHKDIFTDHVMPQMTSPRDGWDNLSDKEDGQFATVEECRAKSLQQPECKQYSFDQDRMCRTRVDPRLGKAGQGVSSGWIVDRVHDFQQGMEPCGNEGWPKGPA